MVLVIKKNFVKGKHNFRPNDKILKLQKKKRPKGALIKVIQ